MAAYSAECRKPAEFIQDPSQRKTAEDLSPESRASVPGCSLRSGNSKRAEFFGDRVVYTSQQTAQKLSGAVHMSKESYFVLGVKGISFYSNTDEIAVRLIKIDENKTLISLEVHMPLQLVGWGHAESLARELYNKLKDECERVNRSNMPLIR
jgi:hypothetical protein